MRTFLVSYDLIKPGRDYSTLHTHLMEYPNWCKPLESLWVIKSNGSPTQIRDTILRYIATNDKLVVVDISEAGAAWINIANEVSSWLQSNL